MRVILFSLVAILLVGISSPTELDVSPPNLTIIVQNALQQIVNLNQLVVEDMRNQEVIFILQSHELLMDFNVAGPVSATVQITNYWFANLLEFSNNIFAKSLLLFKEIIETIRYQIGQLAPCPVVTVYNYISNEIQKLAGHLDNIRSESTARLKANIAHGNAVAIQLNQLALQDCGRNLSELGAKFIENLHETLTNFNDELVDRHAKYIAHTVADLNRLLKKVSEFDLKYQKKPSSSPPMSNGEQYLMQMQMHGMSMHGMAGMSMPGMTMSG